MTFGMKSGRFFLFVVGIQFVVLPACSPDEQAAPELFIDSGMAPYFESFKAEAAERGITVDYVEASIEGYLQDIAGTDILGQCFHDEEGPSRVVIDRTFWRLASTLEREFVVFHELGHCFLQRDHLDTVNPNGTCVSIMQSGLTNCRNAYSSLTRQAYLDELFGY